MLPKVNLATNLASTPSNATDMKGTLDTSQVSTSNGGPASKNPNDINRLLNFLVNRQVMVNKTGSGGTGGATNTTAMPEQKNSSHQSAMVPTAPMPTISTQGKSVT